MGWKIIRIIITTTSNLTRKGMSTNLDCSFCGAHLETTSHLIWECKTTRNLWKFYFPFNVDVLSFDQSYWKSMEH